jgi:hypothetical protein
VQEEDLTAFEWCEPLLAELQPLEGALEELGLAPPEGQVPDPADLPAMPAQLLEPPHARLGVGTRWAPPAGPARQGRGPVG